MKNNKHNCSFNYLIDRSYRDTNYKISNLSCHLQVFDGLRKTNPNFLEKVVPIQGDLSESSLGLHPEDRQRLATNVNILIHNAAVVNFRCRAKLIFRANVLGTLEMLKLATECTRLEAFIYVSTAYSHPDTMCVEEKCYPSPADIKYVQDIIRADEENASGLSEEALNDIIKSVHLPKNIYPFSKAAAESVVEDYSRSATFPCIIYRPSIGMATVLHCVYIFI